MSVQENKAIVRRIYDELWKERELLRGGDTLPGKENSMTRRIGNIHLEG